MADASRLAEEAAGFLDLGAAGYGLVLLAALGEALPLVGFFVPGQWVVLAAGFAVSQGHYAFGLMLALVVVGGIAGDALGYHVGRTHGREFLLKWGPRMRLRPENVGRAQDLLEDYGPVALVLARFTMVTRSLGPLLAGLNHMPRRVFWPVNVLGAVVWGATYFLLGFAFGESTALLGRALGGTALAVVVLGALALAVAWALARRRRRRRRLGGVAAAK